MFSSSLVKSLLSRISLFDDCLSVLNQLISELLKESFQIPVAGLALAFEGEGFFGFALVAENVHPIARLVVVKKDAVIKHQ